MGNYIGKLIKITGITDITEFVQHASKVEGDVICRRGKFAVDAKSLMGMFSIDTSAGFTVEVDANETEFLNYLTKFEG